MAAPARKRPADFTGRQTQDLQAAKAEEIRLRAEELGMMQAAEAESREDVVDLSQGPAPKEAKPAAAASVRKVVVKPATTTIRVNDNIEEMTFGRDDGWVQVDGEMVKVPGQGALRHWNFEANRKYVVPTDLAEHLEEIGYIWH